MENSESTAAGQVHILDSPRAGGLYEIHRSTAREINGDQLGDSDKVKLTDWLIEQRENGVKQPRITRDVLKEIPGRKKTSVRARMDRALWYCEKAGAFSDSIDVLDDPQDDHGPTMMARCSCVSTGELMGILEALNTSGETSISEVNAILGGLSGYKVKITARGLERLEKIAAVNPDSRQGFIAMWFGGDKCKPLMDNVKNAIAKGIKSATFEPVRIDDTQHNGKIDDEIIATIRKSRFVVADMTHGADGPRGGVYYEAGFAFGLGLEVIFTCQDSAIETVHFDTRQYNHILWNENDLPALSKKIRDRIGATIV